MRKEKFESFKPNKTFEAYKEKGRIDFGALSKPELSALFDYYKSHFADLDENSQTEMLEQFLAFRACKEEEAREIFSGMSEEQKKSVGEYIGKAIDSNLYNKFFYDAWQYFDYEQQEFFKEKFLLENPQGIMRIAPFIRLDRFVVSKDSADDNLKFKYLRPQPDWAIRRFGEKPRESLMDRYFNNYEAAEKLMENCLYAAGVNDAGLRAAVEYYSKKEPYFLYPYLPKLLETGIVSQKEAKEIFINLPTSVIFRSDFYLNEEEKNKKKEIFEKAKRINPADKIKDADNIGYLPVQSEKIRREDGLIEDGAQKRSLKRNFANFIEYGNILDAKEREQFFKGLMERQVPIFYVAKELGLKKEEISSLLGVVEDGGETAFFLNDLSDLTALIDIGAEGRAVTHLLRELEEEKDGAYLVRNFMHDIENILPRFSAVNQKKLIKSINNNAYSLWFHRLDYVVKTGVIPFEELMGRAVKEDWAFLENYNRILKQVIALERSGKPSLYDKAKIQEIGRSFLLQRPEQIIYHPGLFINLFSKDKQDEFIKKGLNGLTGRKFLFNALLELDKSKKAGSGDGGIIDWVLYKKEIVETMKSAPEILSDLLENNTYGWSALANVLSPEERFNLFFKQIDSLNLYSVVNAGRGDLILDLAAHPVYFKKFIAKVMGGKDASVLASVFLIGKGLLKNDEAGRKPGAEDYDKKRILADSVKKQLLLNSDSILESLKRFCSEQNFAVFQEDVLDVKDPALTKLAESGVGEYLSIFPEFLSKFRRHFPVSLYNELVNGNLIPTAFLREKYGTPIYDRDLLDKETLSKIFDLNPIDKILAQKSLEEDFYKLVLEEVTANPFLSCYKKQLERIVKEENERNGPRQQVESFSPVREFSDLIIRISVLNSSQAALENQEFIFSLPEKEREELLRVLELILIRGLDRDNKDFDSAMANLSKDPEVSKKMLLGLITDYAGKIFEVDLGELKKVNFEIDAISPLIVYYAVSCKNNPQMKKAFQEFVKRVVAGDYEAWRIADLQFLKEENLIPENLNAEQYQKWSSADFMDFEEIFKLEESDIRSGVRKIFQQAVADQHIKSEDLPASYDVVSEVYSAVCLPMNEWTSQLAALREKTSKKKDSLTLEEATEYRELQVKIADYRSENEEKISLAEANLYLAKLARVTVKELSNKSLDIEGRFVNFNRVFKVLEGVFANSNPDFQQDIKRLQGQLYNSFEKIFGEQKVSKSKMSITDRLDLKTYIKIGQEPVESCQNYNSTSGLNGGLLSYITDPNVKIVQLYDEGGKIIARSVLRFLEDATGNPQLFLERIYSVNPHSKIGEAIREFAKRKAKGLGVSLYSHGLEGAEESFLEESSRASLFSHNSRSPYVYTDAGGGLVKNGNYVINGAVRIS
ncbi:MAG: hypothetical protein HZB99_03025 [Candidatus Harrisonbacteria bacterium]|nr:hypothetical protein [Candidatus Harrisonbacteria bacterium]